MEPNHEGLKESQQNHKWLSYARCDWIRGTGYYQIDITVSMYTHKCTDTCHLSYVKRLNMQRVAQDQVKHGGRHR